jgi:hypothetical protein
MQERLPGRCTKISYSSNISLAREAARERLCVRFIRTTALPARARMTRNASSSTRLICLGGAVARARSCRAYYARQFGFRSRCEMRRKASGVRRCATAISNVSLLAQGRQSYGRFRPRRFRGGNGSELGRSTRTGLKRCAKKTGVMRVGRRGTFVVVRDMQVRGECEQPADDAEHRKRDDSFLDSMCEVHSGWMGAACDAPDLIPALSTRASMCSELLNAQCPARRGFRPAFLRTPSRFRGPARPDKSNLVHHSPAPGGQWR